MISYTSLMTILKPHLQLSVGSKWLRRAMWGIIPILGAVSFYAFSLPTPPIAIDLSAEPLYARGSGAKPTLSLALSVEFPTVGAQFLDNYTLAEEYIGYFDFNSCYTYNNNADASLRRFDRTGPATARECGGSGFSGNFMNWATGSAIDVLRLGLTGGDRIKDEESLTILQRAVIRNSFFNSAGNFPSKNLPASLVNGAVPSTLKGTFAGDIKVANCLNRVHFGTTQTGTCDAPGNNSNLGVAGGSNGTTALTSNNYFFTRVQVCESTDPRTVDGFCLKQASGKYKPIGNLQKYSDRVRIAAFGYLKDDTLARHGGVLRAPMKFLGPNTYDESGALQAGVNPKVEWDVTTGVFKTNPEGASEGISGVVNYLNQFGRTSTTSQGEYKTYDPVGELYYEALRYIQGLQPTPQAVSSITTTMKDGFPVYSTWTDPHAGGSTTSDYSCLKNNIVVVGDKNTHADKSLPGNSSTTSSDFNRTGLLTNEVNFRNWTNVVGGFEAKSSVSYLDGEGISRNTNNPANTNAPNTDPHYPNLADALPYTCCNNNSYLMAGAAYWANTHDIRFANDATKRPGMRAKTYVIDVNEGGGSTNANVRKNNQFSLAAKYGGFTDKSRIGNPFLKVTATNASGQPTAFSLDNSGWQKAAVVPSAPDDPKNYYLASSAKAVLAGLNEIFDSIASEGNSIANGSISTTSFQTGGYIYNAKYDPTDWSGDIISTPVSATSGVVNIAVNTPQWKAATVMNANTSAYFASTRKIIAGRSQGNVDGSAAGVTFDWPSVSGDNGTMKDALDKLTPTAATGDGLAQDRLNYLRGVKTKEGTPFRSRSSLLGDIVNSPVVYSKPFAENVNTAAYKTFMANNSTRPGALFVGANDGMFHAFNADTGAEIFAYIPSWLGSKLPALTDPTYNSTKHQSYVDGQTDIAEALVNSAWKTVLLSSTGGGGQGVFALDVSNPTAFDATKVMWEFTDRDDADLGNVMGTPKVVKIQINSKSDAIPVYKWYAVVPSGVNNFIADGYVSTSKKPHLFLLSLDKTAGTAWAQGTNYYKFEIPTLDTLSATVSPGAVNFQATTGLAGELDVLYMGDLHGNLWKLDFDTAMFATGKTLSNVTFGELTTGNSNKPLFVAKDSSGNVQPIAITPKLVNGPDNGIIVMFGTGKYLETSDNNLTPVRTQSVYAINDIEVGSSRPKFVAGRDYLQQGTSAGGVITINSFIWGRVATANSTTTTERSGWYFDYAASGERSVSDFTTSGLNVYFGTVVPPQNLTDPCSGGSGNIYAVNFATGSGTNFVSQVGLIGQIFIQKTVTSEISDSNSTGTRTEKKTERIVIKGTEGFQTPPDDIKTVSEIGRLGWRQINNYHELKNRP
jgi:type IV pilus assembly protein PilY1